VDLECLTSSRARQLPLFGLLLLRANHPRLVTLSEHKLLAATTLAVVVMLGCGQGPGQVATSPLNVASSATPTPNASEPRALVQDLTCTEEMSGHVLSATPTSDRGPRTDAPGQSSREPST
jgi:hypothetical protein